MVSSKMSNCLASILNSLNKSRNETMINHSSFCSVNAVEGAVFVVQEMYRKLLRNILIKQIILCLYGTFVEK